MKKMFLVTLITSMLACSTKSQANEAPTYRMRYQKTQLNKPSLNSVSQEIQTLKKTAGKQDGEINNLIKQTESDIKRLEKEAIRQEALLHQNANKGFITLHQKINSEIEKIKEEEKKMSTQLRKQIDRELKKLKFATEKKALDIIEQAEVEALKVKNKKREAHLAEKLKAAGFEIESTSAETQSIEKQEPLLNHSPAYIAPSAIVAQPSHPISAEWKNEMALNFYKNITFMKKIILEAENPQEAEDFLQRFSDQNIWFDQTLRATSQTSDPSYIQLMQKQQNLEQVVSAQKKADAALEKLAAKKSLTQAQKQKARLMMLYDLSALVQKKSENKGSFKTPSEEEVTNLAQRITDEVSLQFKEQQGYFPDVTMVDQKTTPVVPVIDLKLKQDLDRVQTQLLRTQNDLKTEQEYSNKIYLIAQDKINAFAHETLETDIVLHQTKTELEKTKQDVAFAHSQLERMDASRNNLIKKIENSDKGNVDLQISLVQAREQMGQIQQQAENKKQEAVEQTKRSFAAQLEQKEKGNLELKVLLENATQKATLFAERAQNLASEQITLKTRLDQAEEKLENQSRSNLEHQTETKAMQELAQRTIASLNNTLAQTKNEMNVLMKSLKKQSQQLAENNTKVSHERALISKEQEQLLRYKSMLEEEQELLEKLKAETQRMVENATRTTADNAIELVKLQQQASTELKKIAQRAAQELEQAAEAILEAQEEEEEA